MLRNPKKKLLGDPTWTGPFKVPKRTKGGSYVLEGLDGTLLPRNAAASQLKSVSHVDTDERANLEAIVNHRKTPQGFEYLVKWHRLSSQHNSWLKPSDFDDVSDIQAYWKRRKPGNNTQTQSGMSPPVRLRLVGGHVDARDAQSPEPRSSVSLKRKRSAPVSEKLMKSYDFLCQPLVSMSLSVRSSQTSPMLRQLTSSGFELSFKP